MSFIANAKNNTVTIPVASVLINSNYTERKAKRDFGDYRKSRNILILNNCVQFNKKEIENIARI